MCPSGARSKKRQYQTFQGGGPSSLEPPAPGVRRPRPRRSRAPSRASTPSSRGRSWLAQAMIPPGIGGTDGLGQVGGIRVQVDLACAERCCPPSRQETAEGPRDALVFSGQEAWPGSLRWESCQGHRMGLCCQEAEACLQGKPKKDLLAGTGGQGSRGLQLVA